jgi:hypothetical protein
MKPMGFERGGHAASANIGASREALLLAIRMAPNSSPGESSGSRGHLGVTGADGGLMRRL